MKRLFFSVFALALGSFVFMSCDDDEKIDGKSGDNEKYMTVAEQQKAIQTSLEGVADAIQFTEFSNAMNVVSGIMGREIGSEELFSILYNSPEILEDSMFQVKMTNAMMMYYGDTIIADLTPYYMEADLLIKDTMLIDTISLAGEGGSTGSYVDTTYQTMLILSNIKHDVEYFQLNVFVDEHEITLKANTKAGESIVTVKDKKGIKNIVLPKSAQLSIALDGQVLATLNGQYDSDLIIYVEDVEEGDDIVRIDGSKVLVSGNLSIASYSLGGSVAFDEKTGIAGRMSLKYGTNELLAANAKLDAVFEGLDIEDTTAVLIWAQDPEKLKSVSGNVSLGGGQIEIKGSLENPFKDETVAKYMRSLMAGVVLTDEQFEEMVAKFNELFNAGIYFKGYEKPQAVLKVKYNKAQNNANGSKADIDDQEPGIVDEIGGALSKVGGYLVFEVRDEAGKAYEISVEDYFKGVDINQFKQTIMEKAMKVFGPFIAQFEGDESDEGDED